jgi:hypothetical protein
LKTQLRRDDGDALITTAAAALGEKLHGGRPLLPWRETEGGEPQQRTILVCLHVVRRLEGHEGMEKTNILNDQHHAAE